MRSISRYLTILLLNLISVQMDAKTLKVAFGKGKPPYVYEFNGELRGLKVDLIREVVLRMGKTFDATGMSYMRLEAEARHGESYDMVVGVRNRDGARFYSKALVDHEVSAYSLKSRRLILRKVQDLSNLRVATWRNSWKDLGPEFSQIFKPRFSGKMPENYVEFVSTKDRFASLWKSGVDVLIMDRHIFDWYRMVNMPKLDMRQDVQVHNIFSAELATFVSFRDARLMAAFNRELQRLRESGEYAKIVRSQFERHFVGYRVLSK